ncbi:hypothetical protein GCM10009122_03140 [Fulvivirga kasyanovii]
MGYNDYVRFFSGEVFCFLNIQHLKYPCTAYRSLVHDCKFMDGKKFEVQLREALKKAGKL